MVKPVVPDTTHGTQLPEGPALPPADRVRGASPQPKGGSYGKNEGVPPDDVGHFPDLGEIVRRPSGSHQGPPKIEFSIHEEVSSVLLRDFSGTRPVRTQYPVGPSILKPKPRLPLFKPSFAYPVPSVEKVVTDPCLGADVLIRGCTPQRRIALSYEWSTEPVPPTQVLLLAGGLLVVAVAWEVAAAYGAASTTLEWVGTVAAAL